MKRVYVAGKYDDDNIVSVLDNMQLGMRTCTELLLKGYAPFCPWLDYHYALMLREGEHIKKETYHLYSLKWLEVSDCVLALPNYKNSGGALREIEIAKKLDIPIFYLIWELERNTFIGMHENGEFIKVLKSEKKK
jgi:hypothetical protein